MSSIKIKTRFQELVKPERLVFHKVYANFLTVDGVWHRSCNYNWCKVSALLCSAGEYVMIRVKDDGYIKDSQGSMFVLQNIISIQWIVDEVREYIDTESSRNQYRIWYSDEDFTKLNPWQTGVL